MLVSDDPDLIKEVGPLIAKALGSDPDEVARQLGNPPGPTLVRDPQTGSGHLSLDEHDPDRRLELVRFDGDEVVVETQHPSLLDAAFDLVGKAPPDEPVESPSRRTVELRLHRADAASYGSLKPAGSSTHPDVLAQFIRAYVESDHATDGERSLLRSLLPEIAEAAELEAADEGARQAWDTARRERDEARSELESQKRWTADSRRRAAAARDRVDEAERRTLQTSESKLAELESEAVESENALEAAEEKLDAAKAAAIKATVREHEAREEYEATIAREEPEDAE